MEHEKLQTDILIVGAGPAGLSAAIRLAQLSQQKNLSLNITVIEKGSEVGAHILSGAAIDPRSLNELIPDWAAKNAPLNIPVQKDHFYFLTKKRAIPLPIPPHMKNHGCYIISLGVFCRWLAQQAEQLGVQIFSGFSGQEIIYDHNYKVIGIRTDDKGLNKEGQPTSRFQPGFIIEAKQTLFAEGCHGSLTKQVIEKFDLRKTSPIQTYGLGVKELWEVPPHLHHAGTVIHTVGWPLKYNTYGGSFIYHYEKNIIALGYVVGLDYQNTFLDPYEELQQFKTHPILYDILRQGKRIGYGARAINEGGFQAIPKLTFPGGMLIGDSAGFLNVPRIKGTHTAMKSGIVAAEAIAQAWPNVPDEIFDYPARLKNSWLYEELYGVRNIRPGFKYGLLPGLANAAIDTYIFRGKAPWTLQYPYPDYAMLKKAKDCKRINYPKHDNIVSFDKLSSVYLANVSGREDQPCHLKLVDPELAISITYKEYDSPETRYCPANVYEIVMQDGRPKLQINAPNCVQCKTCDIKDPIQNIIWTPPEGGDGPHYSEM